MPTFFLLFFWILFLYVYEGIWNKKWKTTFLAKLSTSVRKSISCFLVSSLYLVTCLCCVHHLEFFFCLIIINISCTLLPNSKVSMFENLFFTMISFLTCCLWKLIIQTEDKVRVFPRLCLEFYISVYFCSLILLYGNCNWNDL